MSHASLTREVVFLRQRDVLSRVGFGETTLKARVAERTFPAPLKLSPRVTVWRSDEIARWMDQQMANREAA